MIPREEGRILYDMNPRKQKKTKGIYKVYNVSFTELLLVRTCIFAMHSLVAKIGRFVVDITLNMYIFAGSRRKIIGQCERVNCSIKTTMVR